MTRRRAALFGALIFAAPLMHPAVADADPVADFYKAGRSR